MSTTIVGPDGYHHPATEADLRFLIQHARTSGLKLRVRGAGHSEPAAYEAGRGSINVLLDRMSAVDFDDEQMQVTVGAGCHLGFDPEDPSGSSTRDNSLFAQLDRHGWAVNAMGGITRQTVGGFLSTGSAGGSLAHATGDLIVRIRLMDGTGNVHEFSRSDDPGDPFYAAGVSMGLLGVITAVTLQCVSRFDVQGEENTSNYSGCEVDLFGSGSSNRPDLATFLEEVEHGRLIWWPQKGVEKVTVWKATELTPGTNCRRRPYKQVRSILGSSYPAYFLISLALRGVDSLNAPAPRGWLSRGSEGVLAFLYRLIAGKMLHSSRQQFCDAWWRTLPMDDGTNYRLLPIGFTELWLPLENAQMVMNVLRDHYERGGFPATGTYACEIYASPASKFWMSPAYGRPVLKVDVFWFRKSKADPYREFYPQFWDLLQGFNYSLHWGKALSGDVEYLRQRYPRWNDFLQLRSQLDPDDIFLTDYWRRHLGVVQSSN